MHKCLQLVGLFLLLKLIYLLFGIVVSSEGFVEQEYDFSLDTYAKISMRKDAFWYEQIAREGYSAGELQADGSRRFDFTKEQSSWAFFPAYPVFNSTISKVFSVEYKLATSLSSLLFSLLALIGCFLFFRDYWKDEQQAFFTTVVIFLFPFHFYFSMFLTEAPFFACLIWSFYLLQKRQDFAASWALVPLVLLRPNGLAMLLLVFMFFLEREQISLFKAYRQPGSYKGILLCTPAVIAFVAYAIFQHQMTGDYLAFGQAQAGWGKQAMFPLSALYRQGGLNYQATSTYVLLVATLVVVFRKKLPLSFHTIIALTLLLPLSAGSTFGMIRYVSIAFPVFLIIADLLYPIQKKALLYGVLLVLHLGSFYLWLIDFPLAF